MYFLRGINMDSWILWPELCGETQHPPKTALDSDLHLDFRHSCHPRKRTAGLRPPKWRVVQNCIAMDDLSEHGCWITCCTYRVAFQGVGWECGELTPLQALFSAHQQANDVKGWNHPTYCWMLVSGTIFQVRHTKYTTGVQGIAPPSHRLQPNFTNHQPKSM